MAGESSDDVLERIAITKGSPRVGCSFCATCDLPIEPGTPIGIDHKGWHHLRPCYEQTRHWTKAR